MSKLQFFCNYYYKEKEYPMTGNRLAFDWLCHQPTRCHLLRVWTVLRIERQFYQLFCSNPKYINTLWLAFKFTRKILPPTLLTISSHRKKLYSLLYTIIFTCSSKYAKYAAEITLLKPPQNFIILSESQIFVNWMTLSHKVIFLNLAYI